MHFNLIGRGPGLAVREIIHPDTGDQHRDVGGLERTGGRITGVEYLPGTGNAAPVS